MILVRVELWSARDRSRVELARVMIHNVGGTATVADYDGEAYRGRSTPALDRAMLEADVTRQGAVRGHRKQDLHVWNLVARMLASMGYGR
ncbi:MAG TPA: hypothetical protein PKD99_02490 [Sphingopyxis sp.]|nr:hypothetical protein [Sphingopyxis sp.]HMP43946.1 hypothetical protein [Sphingopyxis sp.]HMQ20291.1 hypothetical protein [Sphingopyxis sp.]